MDSGRPFRIARPERSGSSVRRSPVVKPEKAPTPAPAKKEVVTPPPSRSPEAIKPPAKRRRLGPLLTGLAILVLLILGLFTWRTLGSTDSVIDETQYQAVTVVDGSIYFGKVSDLSVDYVEIKDAYFLQASTDAPSSDSDQPPAQTGKLVQLNNKLYAPAGSIVISKQQVLTFEPLDPDGQVVQLLGGDS